VDKVVKAPFTDEQVKAIQAWQDEWGLYTCCSHNNCDRINQPNEGLLNVTNEGFVCPCGDYTQNWCSDIMVTPVPSVSSSVSRFKKNGPPKDWIHKDFK